MDQSNFFINQKNGPIERQKKINLLYWGLLLFLMITQMWPLVIAAFIFKPKLNKIIEKYLNEAIIKSEEQGKASINIAQQRKAIDTNHDLESARGFINSANSHKNYALNFTDFVRSFLAIAALLALIIFLLIYFNLK